MFSGILRSASGHHLSCDRDIVVSSQHGNIMDPAVRAFWVHGARQGIHSFVAGPLCETWSQARENDLGGDDDDYKGPRVLRTAARPWGYSLGRNAQGEFQTARLKEYPPALCRNFASSIRDSMDCVPIDDSNDPTADFLAVCQQLEVSLYSKTMGRDFHG